MLLPHWKLLLSVWGIAFLEGMQLQLPPGGSGRHPGDLMEFLQPYFSQEVLFEQVQYTFFCVVQGFRAWPKALTNILECVGCCISSRYATSATL